jgi:hypothetical protein
MRPMRLVLLAAALPLLAPVSAFAGKGPPPPPEEGIVLDDPLEGDYFFHDKLSIDKLKTFVSIDQKGGDICVNGLALSLDVTQTLNRRVEWEFLSFGTIDKQGPGKLQGIFTSVELRLTIFDGPETTNNIVFESVVTDAPCEFDAKLQKVGFDFDPDVDHVVGSIKATLVCELGPNLLVKGKLSEAQLSNIAVAFGGKKNIKLKLSTGDLRINHNGFRVDPVEDGLDFTGLDCLTNVPPPPPPE